MKDYHCDDKDVLVAFLYGELGADERRQVEAHLDRCPACFDEVSGLSGVRQELAAWLPPEPDLGFTIVQKAGAAAARPARWWAGPVPAWAQAAAAVLVLAAGAAIANVQVRYDDTGVTVSTGWRTAGVAAPSTAAAEASADREPWREALTSLERDLRSEMDALKHASTAAVEVAGEPADSDAATLRRVQRLIEESERRQRQELALRLTQFGRDVEMQRRADLVRIEQGVGQLQGRTDAQVARQRELLNYLVRVSGRQVLPQ